MITANLLFRVTFIVPKLMKGATPNKLVKGVTANQMSIIGIETEPDSKMPFFIIRNISKKFQCTKTGFERCVMQITIAIKVPYRQLGRTRSLDLRGKW
ncbi:hypothetical protein T02_6475 [Trichinella nativa]|uniref:Uncharacterized protein n=1 Tax=Trichinella nativa TaxID=6335 RepID=A0A0V1KNQ3_9BILA|nr:hypothetical protein T02_6475 [Trichinella nativa]